MGVAAVGSLRVSEWWSGRLVRLVALACVVVAGVLTTGGLVEAAPTVERWSGADRYSTSVRVSKEAFPAGADVVFVATGESFPDALAAGPAAATLDGPILLTATNELPAVVSTELQRLAPSTVYLLGGNAAITPLVESQVDAATSADVERIAGADRYSTAAAVTELAFPTADTVYVAAGTGFADALSAGAPGGRRGRPVLLTASGAVPVASRGQITRLGDPDIIVLGGTAAISNAVLAELDSLTTGSVKRVSGSDRYATSVAVSVDAFTEADTVFLATGTAFPDALSAAPAATNRAAPILLTKPACAPAKVIAEVNRLGATNVIALGGTDAVSNAAASLTPCPLPPPPPPPPTTADLVRAQQIKLNELLTPYGYPKIAVDGISGPITRRALCASRLALFLPVNRAYMRPGSAEEKRLLASPTLPVPPNVGTKGKWIFIDMTCQVMFTGEGTNRLVNVFPTSTGAPGFETRLQERTPAFRYDPALRNYGWHNSSLYPVASDNPLNGNMYKPLYFDRGQAIHGSNSVPTSPQSKGCARLRPSDMDRLVSWLGLDGLRGPTNSPERIGVTVTARGHYGLG